MGAVSALLYASNHLDKVSCLILDSPFSSLQLIFKDTVKRHKFIPKILAKYAYNASREQIMERLGIDITQIDPIKAARKCSLPAILIHGTADAFVNIAHSYSLMKEYLGPCSLLEAENLNHNALRPE